MKKNAHLPAPTSPSKTKSFSHIAVSKRKFEGEMIKTLERKAY